MSDQEVITMSSAEKQPLMDLSAVAERLGVGERHVRRLVFERRIPFIKWSHLLRFDHDEIERWIDDARRPSTSDVTVTPTP